MAVTTFNANLMTNNTKYTKEESIRPNIHKETYKFVFPQLKYEILKGELKKTTTTYRV